MLPATAGCFGAAHIHTHTEREKRERSESNSLTASICTSLINTLVCAVCPSFNTLSAQSVPTWKHEAHATVAFLGYQTVKATTAATTTMRHTYTCMLVCVCVSA